MKNSLRVRPEDLTDLKRFADDYPQCTLILVHRGDQHLKIGTVQCIPAQAFFSGLIPARASIV